jgi:hypothetical protein
MIEMINSMGLIRAQYSTPSRYFAALNTENISFPVRDSTDLLPLSGIVFHFYPIYFLLFFDRFIRLIHRNISAIVSYC